MDNPVALAIWSGLLVGLLLYLLQTYKLPTAYVEAAVLVVAIVGACFFRGKLCTCLLVLTWLMLVALSRRAQPKLDRGKTENEGILSIESVQRKADVSFEPSASPSIRGPKKPERQKLLDIQAVYLDLAIAKRAVGNSKRNVERQYRQDGE